jgi:sec-independent protein translocase protein TatA
MMGHAATGDPSRSIAAGLHEGKKPGVMAIPGVYHPFHASPRRYMLMGALAPWHWAVIIVVIFLIFGGRLIPRLGRSLGQSLTGLKKGLQEGSEGFKSAMAEEPESSKPALTKSEGGEPPKNEHV